MKETCAYFIKYVVPIIKNYLNCSTCDDLECSKIKVGLLHIKILKELNYNIVMIYMVI